MLITQDIQTHTCFSDGSNSVEEMVRGAIEKGLKSVVVSDHAKGWIHNNKYIYFFPTQKIYEKYLKEIGEAKELFKTEIKVMAALEIEIGLGGETNLDKGILEYRNNNLSLKKLGVDILIGSIHSESFAEDCERLQIKEVEKREKLIENMCNLIKNKNIDVFAHPFQAIHGHFSNNLSESETEEILNTFKAEWVSGHNIYLEINGKKYPNYNQWDYDKYSSGEMETNDGDFINKYKEIGGKFVIGSDAHSVSSLHDVDLSVFDKVKITEDDIHVF